MSSIDDYVLNPRTVDGQRVAESLSSGQIIQYDARFYSRTPFVYRGQSVYSRVECHDLERFLPLLQARETALREHRSVIVTDQLGELQFSQGDVNDE